MDINAMEIIKIFNDDSAVILGQQSSAIVLDDNGLNEAKIIADQLIKTLKPLMPAAGLAAPQIGISKQVFIYSWDRTMENMVVAINPKILNFEGDMVLGWGACLSAIQENGISQAALVSSADTITVEYSNLKGELIKQQLTGFAAKVFQHEYDHLQGVVNVKKEGVEVKTFDNEAELVEFMNNVKKNDSVNYIQPITFKQG